MVYLSAPDHSNRSLVRIPPATNTPLKYLSGHGSELMCDLRRVSELQRAGCSQQRNVFPVFSTLPPLTDKLSIPDSPTLPAAPQPPVLTVQNISSPQGLALAVLRGVESVLIGKDTKFIRRNGWLTLFNFNPEFHRKSQLDSNITDLNTLKGLAALMPHEYTIDNDKIHAKILAAMSENDPFHDTHGLYGSPAARKCEGGRRTIPKIFLIPKLATPIRPSTLPPTKRKLPQNVVPPQTQKKLKAKTMLL